MDNQLKEKYFKQYEKVLHKFAYSFEKMYDIEKDELFGEACLTFLKTCEKFDNEKAQFNTFLHLKLDSDLKHYCKRMKRKTQHISQLEDIITKESHNKHLIYKSDFHNFLNEKLSLSNTSQEIIVALDNAKIKPGKKNKITKQTVYHYMYKQGYSHHEIYKAFDELKEVAKNA